MNRLRFLVARMFHHEGALASLGMPLTDAMRQFSGSIALVGNARSLAGSHYGAAIDAADHVIRINRAPMPDPYSHGTRTDSLALATGLDNVTLYKINPRLILWMSHKRKRLPWAVAQHPGFVLPPLTDYNRLRVVLGAPPTTGLLVIDLLAHTAATSIALYGFDFFDSLSLSGRRTAAQTPHDFAAERHFTDALIARDPRFALRL